MIKERVKLIPEDSHGSFGSLMQLVMFMGTEKIPIEAEIRYAGCGSHRIEFFWEETEPDEVVPGIPVVPLLGNE